MSAVPSRVHEEVFPPNPSTGQTNEEVFSFLVCSTGCIAQTYAQVILVFAQDVEQFFSGKGWLVLLGVARVISEFCFACYYVYSLAALFIR
jgi:hypothetical protein